MRNRGKTRQFFAFFFLLFLPGPSYAATAQEFQESLAQEKLDFERSLSALPPGPRTREIGSFEESRRARAQAFQEELLGLSLSEQTQRTEEYIAETLRLKAEHEAKLKTMPPDFIEVSRRRQEFQKNRSDRIREFNESNPS